jgi:hypothetical protein
MRNRNALTHDEQRIKKREEDGILELKNYTFITGQYPKHIALFLTKKSYYANKM